jgi:hypothetical protein
MSMKAVKLRAWAFTLAILSSVTSRDTQNSFPPLKNCVLPTLLRNTTNQALWKLDTLQLNHIKMYPASMRLFVIP